MRNENGSFTLMGNEEVAYQRGYREGFLDGQAKGLSIAQYALANSIQPIVIKCDSKEFSKEFAEQIIRSVGGKDESTSV